MNKNKLLPALPAILFIALVSIVFTIMGILPYDRPSTNATNSFGNLANGGAVSDGGSMLYYVDGKDILRCQSDQSTYFIDEGASCLSPYRNGIIYLAKSGEIKYSAYNGEGKSTLAHAAREMMVCGNWIFYQDTDGYLHKYAIKTDKCYDINIKVKQFMVSGTTVIYTDEHGYMYSARTDGSEIAPFFAESTDKFIRHDSYIFYLSDGMIYSVTLSNTAQKHTYCNADMFNVSEDNILYYTDGGALYSMDITQKSPTAVNITGEHGVSDKGIFCVDDRVFYYDTSGTLVSCKKDGAERLEY